MQIESILFRLADGPDIFRVEFTPHTDRLWAVTVWVNGVKKAAKTEYTNKKPLRSTALYFAKRY